MSVGAPITASQIIQERIARFHRDQARDQWILQPIIDRLSLLLDSIETPISENTCGNVGPR